MARPPLPEDPPPLRGAGGRFPPTRAHENHGHPLALVLP